MRRRKFETTKRGRGRPALYVESKTKRVNITVDDKTLEKLRYYGGGNLSLGVRMAARLIDDVKDSPLLRQQSRGGENTSL